MHLRANRSSLPDGTWTLPVVGLTGTVAGILFGFARIRTEPGWTTVLQAVGLSVAVTAAILIVLCLAGRSRR